MAYRVERQRIETLSFYAAILLLSYLVYRLLEPFLVPLLWAVVFAVFFYPWYAKLEPRWGRTVAASVAMIVVTLIIIVPSLLLMVSFIRQAGVAMTDLENALSPGNMPRLERAWTWTQVNLLNQRPTDLADLTRQATAYATSLIAARAGSLLRNVVERILDLFVTILAMFFLFRDGSHFVNLARRMLPFDPAHRDRMLAQARDLTRATVISSLAVAAIQGLLGGLAFAVLGLNAPIFWGIMMGFFALLPFGGTWIIWLPAALWLLAVGNLGRGIALIVIGATVVGTADNVLRPLLLSGRTRLNGLTVFISLLGGIAAFGLVGLVLGPVVVATAAGLLKTYTAPE
jgi:predicted PurR-regulated permease PerM